MRDVPAPIEVNRPPYWSRQHDLCRSVVDYRTTVAYSGNMVGKDFWIAGIVLWWLLTRPNSLCIITGPSQMVLGSVTFKEIRRCLDGAFLPFGGKLSSGLKASPAGPRAWPSTPSGFPAPSRRTPTWKRAHSVWPTRPGWRACTASTARALWVRSHIDALIPNVSSERLIDPTWLHHHSAQQRQPVPPNHPVNSTRRIACDLAEGVGRDSTCIVVADWGALEVQVSSNMGLPEAAAAIRRLVSKWNVPHERIIFDVLGIGRNFPNHLARYGITTATPYAGEGRPRDPKTYVNLRAQFIVEVGDGCLFEKVTLEDGDLLATGKIPTRVGYGKPPFRLC